MWSEFFERSLDLDDAWVHHAAWPNNHRWYGFVAVGYRADNGCVLGVFPNVASIHGDTG